MRHRIVLVLLTAVLAAGACSDDGAEEPDVPTTTTATPEASTSTVAEDPELSALLLTLDDLPGEFTANEDVGDTVTSFCANEDAAAGLQASGRAIAGFRRTPAGVSVLQVVFRFRDDGAATFVRQADEILERCDSVPDISGLAFDYEDAPADLLAALDGDAATASTGVSIGSGNLRSVVGVVQHGDLGSLVAVLAVDTDPAVLADLARAAFTAASARLAG